MLRIPKTSYDDSGKTVRDKVHTGNAPIEEMEKYEMLLTTSGSHAACVVLVPI